MSKDIFHLVLLLNIWLCLISVLMVVASSVALSIPLSVVGVGLALPALLSLSIYIHDRRDISHEDWINQPYRTQLVKQYRNQLGFVEFIALGGYEILLLFLIYSRHEVGLEFFFLGQLPIVVLVLYSSLKRYPIVDSVAVGSTWAFMMIFTVLVSTGYPVSLEMIVVFVAWFIIVVAGVESRNIHDIEGDVKTNKTTLAAHLGATNASVLETVLKITGVLIFWHLSGMAAAIIVVGYLVLLRIFRSLTQRVRHTHDGRQQIPRNYYNK